MPDELGAVAEVKPIEGSPAPETAVGTPETAPAAVDTAIAETPATPVDPNDPMAALEAALAAEMPEQAAETPENSEAVAIPEQFQQALQISDFVKSPENVQQAVRAADEVWKVATGQLPARTMLEGFRESNPQQYQAIMQDLTSYIEQATGQKFGGTASAEPVDPRDARLQAIEQRFQQEEQQRQEQVYTQQVNQARTVALDAITKAAKGTFAEGNEAYILQQCAAKVGIPEKEMVNLLLQGKTQKLEAAFKAVQREEGERLKQYSAKLIKNYRTMKNAVPATKGGPGAPAASANAPARKPGESDMAFAQRLWNSEAAL